MYQMVGTIPNGLRDGDQFRCTDPVDADRAGQFQFGRGLAHRTDIRGLQRHGNLVQEMADPLPPARDELPDGQVTKYVEKLGGRLWIQFGESIGRMTWDTHSGSLYRLPAGRCPVENVTRV